MEFVDVLKKAAQQSDEREHSRNWVFVEKTLCFGHRFQFTSFDTIGHCVRHKMVDNLKVHLGKHNSSQINEVSEQIRQVSQMHIHPQFDPKTWNMDFALLKLSSIALINDYVRTVCLPAPTMTAWKGMAVATGWGYSKPASKFRPDILQYIKIPTWEEGKCGQFDSSLITKDMICAGGQEKDACQVRNQTEKNFSLKARAKCLIITFTS